MKVPNDRQLCCWDYAGLAVIGLLGLLASIAMGCQTVSYIPAEDGTALVRAGGRWYMTDEDHAIVAEFPERWEPTEFKSVP